MEKSRREEIEKRCDNASVFSDSLNTFRALGGYSVLSDIRYLLTDLEAAEKERDELKAIMIHPTYGTILDLIEEIRLDYKSGWYPRMGQMGALFRLNFQIRESLGLPLTSEEPSRCGCFCHSQRALGGQDEG